jgi:hypothetical protein
MSKLIDVMKCLCDSTSGEESENDDSVSDCGSRCSSEHANENINSSCTAQYEDVDDLLGDLGFEDNTQLWPQEPLKPFGNFK